MFKKAPNQPNIALLSLIILIFLMGGSLVFAKIGVGVGIGKIRVDKPLKAGGIYNMATIPVLNTGDEPADYQFSIQYHENQEMRSDMGQKPGEKWFNFIPDSFHLKPNEIQVVKIVLTLPPKTKPGTYFAYLEAHPVRKSIPGQTSVGIAAATQLWFTVAPANFFQGIYYRFTSLYSRYHPWDTIILGVIFAVVLLRSILKKFRFQIVKK